MNIPDGKKIYFASDIHLGMYPLKESFEREKLFVKWLTDIENDAHEIFLVGDIFDFWYEYKKVVPRGYVRFLGKIANLTDKGINVHFFTGNHDVWMFDYLTKETGVKIHRNPIIYDSQGARFYIGHGDGLGPGDASYKFLKLVFTNKILQWLFSKIHPDLAFWLGHSWSKKSRYTKGVEPEKDKGENELLVKYARGKLKTEHIDYFVFGHRHLALHFPLNKESEFICLGDWIFNFTYACFDGSKMKLKKYK